MINFEKTGCLLKNTDTRYFLNRIKTYDMNLYEHSIKTAMLMELILPYFKIQEGISDMEVIKGALLHDIGKLSIDKKILEKKGVLADDEFEIIKKHPAEGISFLSAMSEIVKSCCLMHHENLDGTGYPYKRKGEEIPDYCKLLSIIDKIEAVTNADRVYRIPIKDLNVLEEYINGEIRNGHIDSAYARRIMFILKDTRADYKLLDIRNKNKNLTISEFGGSSVLIFDF